ncbi:hypothetical protein TRFO_05912 [Tritrichomonas foetus]|uniref:Uncharacterized protein n=1 Tax=Tritrichomonas foetus TaxID=1144522 RepID=A0A1J4K2Z5_9EUKA|nr:hypothetical protein TRFO_05912 [Tritrichomonas foetus]|eukprot:OHT05338.1 hypothetical protein TRFO_05912 [Tritrichomonas foetus]
MSKNGSSSSSEKQQDPIQRALDWANSRLSAFEETATDITTDFTSGQYFVTLIEDITQEELKITYRNPKTIFQKRLTIDACLKYLDNYRFITPIPVKREDILWGETIPTYNLLRMINVRLDNGDLPPLPHDFRPRPPLTSRVQKVEKSQQTNKVTSKKCVGIDIGTSQTKYSIFSRNHVNKFNSVISIRENKKKIGGILKGADHIVLDFKRFIGRDFTDDSLEDETRKMKIYAIEEDSTNFRPIIKLENNKTDSSSNKQISNANNLSKSKKLNDSILHSSKSSSNNVSDRNQNENHNDYDESQKTFTFEQMTAYLFNKIKKSISTESGDDVNDAVLSVPSYFSISQRYALRDAATIAGFNVISVITEPVATGIATRFISSSELKSKNSSNQNPKPGTSSNSKHGKSTISQQKISNSKPTTSNSKPTTSNSKPTTSNTKPNISSGLKTNNKSTNSKQSDSSSKQIKKSNQNNIVIVDVGGGKTEASLLLIDKNNIKPIRNEFNSKLGGSNFDHALAKKYFTYKNSKPETPHEKMQIILAAEHAKIALSTKKQTKIKEMNITKDEFEDCCENLINEIIDPIKRLFSDDPNKKKDLKKWFYQEEQQKYQKLKKKSKIFLEKELRLFFLDLMMEIIVLLPLEQQFMEQY